MICFIEKVISSLTHKTLFDLLNKSFACTGKYLGSSPISTYGNPVSFKNFVIIPTDLFELDIGVAVLSGSVIKYIEFGIVLPEDGPP